MALQIANIRDWTPEQVGTAASDIHDCIQRIVDEHPDELTVKWLIDEMVADRKQLWVAFDEAEPDTVVMVAFTEIRHFLATGHTYTQITGLAGDGIHEVLPMLRELERWGQERGAQSTKVKGRDGWTKLLKPHGYTRTSTELTKTLA